MNYLMFIIPPSWLLTSVTKKLSPYPRSYSLSPFQVFLPKAFTSPNRHLGILLYLFGVQVFLKEKCMIIYYLLKLKISIEIHISSQFKLKNFVEFFFSLITSSFNEYEANFLLYESVYILWTIVFTRSYINKFFSKILW